MNRRSTSFRHLLGVLLISTLIWSMEFARPPLRLSDEESFSFDHKNGIRWDEKSACSDVSTVSSVSSVQVSNCPSWTFPDSPDSPQFPERRFDNDRAYRDAVAKDQHGCRSPNSPPIGFKADILAILERQMTEAQRCIEMERHWLEGVSEDTCKEKTSGRKAWFFHQRAIDLPESNTPFVPGNPYLDLHTGLPYNKQYEQHLKCEIERNQPLPDNHPAVLEYEKELDKADTVCALNEALHGISVESHIKESQRERMMLGLQY